MISHQKMGIRHEKNLSRFNEDDKNKEKPHFTTKLHFFMVGEHRYHNMLENC